LPAFAAARDSGQVHLPKNRANVKKYPADKVRGSSKKYIEL